MKGSLKKNLISAIVLVVCFAGAYAMKTMPMFTGTPYSISIDGYSVLPGETKVQDLAGQGYMLSDFKQKTFSTTDMQYNYTGFYNLDTMAEATTIYTGIDLVRDNENVASLYIMNASRQEKKLSECEVNTIALWPSQLERGGYAVEGIPMEELTVEALTEKCGTFKNQSESQDDDGNPVTVTTWKKGKYSLELRTKEDGTLDRVTSKYND
ncbi:hypothetical protein D5274_11875 [bacterium 1XD42-94]|jgi:hypothetical protein|nr:hypothetical protein [bacterium 1XD42-76]NBK05823.1 hypothetical protein [bacterium 1XD42-94]